MSANEPRENLEIERKYEVVGDAPLPDAAAFASLGFAAADPVLVRLAASYFDTADRALAAAGWAMRVRLGGADEGWHLKERRSEGVREYSWPVSEEIPEALRETLRERVGSAAADAVEPVASLRTERTIVRLDRDGIAVIELADDRVLASDHALGIDRAWHEWEAERLGDADPGLLDLIEPLLLARGAATSLSFAKIARATGQLTPLAVESGADARVLAALSVLDLADRLEATGDRRRSDELRTIAGFVSAAPPAS